MKRPGRPLDEVPPMALLEEQLAIRMELRTDLRQSAEPLLARYRLNEEHIQRLRAELSQRSGYSAESA